MWLDLVADGVFHISQLKDYWDTSFELTLMQWQHCIKKKQKEISHLSVSSARLSYLVELFMAGSEKVDSSLSSRLPFDLSDDQCQISQTACDIFWELVDAKIIKGAELMTYTRNEQLFSYLKQKQRNKDNGGS